MTSHLNALKLRLSNERVRAALAKTKSEQTIRNVWIAQIEKEIRTEETFTDDVEMSDDELLAALR